MSSDPAVSGKEAVQALQRLGFRLDRVEGSHHMLLKAGQSHTVVVPVHGSHVLPKGTLASIIRGARVSRKQFFEAIGQRGSR
jgi:predicted RNA binding protein YcfA (HicA-like mRNA interferase family)